MKSNSTAASPSSSSSVNGNSTSSSKSSALGRLCRKLSPRKADKGSSSVPTNTSDPTATVTVSNELRRVFDFFDEDGDGKISPVELQSCVRTVGGELSMEEAKAAVRSSDMDGDGLLGFEDFQCLMEGSANSEEEKTSELRQAFGMYETEPGSGCITPTSLKRMLNRLGESRSIADCKTMIRSFDLNGDGVLNFHEFAVMMR